MTENNSAPSVKKLSDVVDEDAELVIEEGNRVLNFVKKNGKKFAVTTALVLGSAVAGYVLRDVLNSETEVAEETVALEVKTTETSSAKSK